MLRGLALNELVSKGCVRKREARGGGSRVLILRELLGRRGARGRAAEWHGALEPLTHERGNDVTWKYFDDSS